MKKEEYKELNAKLENHIITIKKLIKANELFIKCLEEHSKRENKNGGNEK